MKRILINEQQYRYLLGEAMSDSFSFDALKNMSLQEAIRYCRKELGPHIGVGSSRVVFQLSDEKVLKLALNEAGRAQNRLESINEKNYNEYGLMPYIFHEESDEANYTFIVAEYVLPYEDGDVEHCYNIRYGDFCSFLMMCVWNWKRDTDERYAPMPMKLFKQYLINPDFNKWRMFILKNRIDDWDFFQKQNLGMAKRDGKPTIVVLDNGYNEEIKNQFYA